MPDGSSDTRQTAELEEEEQLDIGNVPNADKDKISCKWDSVIDKILFPVAIEDIYRVFNFALFFKEADPPPYK